MLYRRYGRTELAMPVITCGGMRYQASWNSDEVEKISEESQANLAATIQRTVELGMTHVETTRGYGTSELQIGRVLGSGQVERDRIILQTKLGPTDTGDEWLTCFEESLERLQTDRIDLLAVHGINNRETLHKTLAPGGPLDVAERLRQQGRAKHIGFSSHGPTDILLEAIGTNRFDYMNLHWFWIFFPGAQLGETNPADLAKVLGRSPYRDRIPDIVAEAHEMLKAEETKRLQEDG